MDNREALQIMTVRDMQTAASVWRRADHGFWGPKNGSLHDKVDDLIAEVERLRTGLRMISEYVEQRDLESIRLIVKTVNG